MKHRPKLALFVAISLAVHICVLWFVGRAPPPQKAKLPPLALSLRAPPPKPVDAPPKPVDAPPKPVEEEKPKVIPKTQVPVAATPVEPTSVEPTPAASDSKVPDTSGSPRMNSGAPTADKRVSSGGTIVKLGDGSLMGLAGSAPRVNDQPRAAGDDGLDEMTRVQQRLAKDVEGFKVQQDTKTGARGTVASLRRAFRERFEPASGFVKKIPKSAKANAQIAQNMMDAGKRPQSTTAMNNGLVPSQQAMQPGLNDACAQSHEIGRMEVRVHVDHDAKGQVEKLVLQVPSGDPAFDAYAEDVVKRSVNQPLKSYADEAIPLFSEWLLSQIVYDWWSNPLCPPPPKPAGSPVLDDAGNPMNGITHVAEVSLVTVRYRH
jgi:outer membrane biosynthesis protein TonB